MNEPIIGLFSRSYEHATRGGDPGLEMFASPTKAFSGFLDRLEEYSERHGWQGIEIAFKIIRELVERGKVAFVIQTGEIRPHVMMKLAPEEDLVEFQVAALEERESEVVLLPPL